MIFFTADLHFGHKNIIKYCKRPFETVDEMDAKLLNNINASVGVSDQLYIVGDFAMGRDAVRIANYRSRIACSQIFFVFGNHDYLSAAEYEAAGFIVKGHLIDLRLNNQAITLCHYAMRRWNKSHNGAWQLYGHSHGQLPDDPTLFSFDVGVDCHSFQPLSFDNVASLMAKRTEAIAAPNHQVAVES